MNWKTRQLFSDREHGIVSGLSPVNMAGGGTVPIPGYQDGTSPEEAEYIDAMQAAAMMGVPNEQTGLRRGFNNLIRGWSTIPKGTSPELAEYIKAARAGAMAGGTEAAQAAPEEPSIEQRVAELAAKMGISVPAARAMILTQMLEQQGVTLPEEVINQFATGLITLHDALSQAVGPPKMQAGTGLGEAMAIDLFQQGDEEINEPLNRMVQSTNPSIADITPTEIGEAVTMDQGPTDTEVGKAPFQQMAVEVVKEATMSLAREDYMNIEQVQQEVEQQLNAIDETYRQQTGATDTILTEEFLAQLDNLMLSAGEEFENAPGMEKGTNEKDATTMDMTDIIEAMASAGADPAEIEKIIKKYYPGGTGMSEEMLQNRISRARRGALLGGKTKQGGWAGMMDILGQADAAEVAAMGSMPETLATNEAALKRLAMSGELEAAGGSTSASLTAKMKEIKLATAIRASGLSKEEQGVYLSILTGDKSRAELDQALWAKILDRAMVWGASSPVVKSHEEIYAHALAIWQKIGQTSKPPPVKEGADDKTKEEIVIK